MRIREQFLSMHKIAIFLGIVISFFGTEFHLSNQTNVPKLNSDIFSIVAVDNDKLAIFENLSTKNKVTVLSGQAYNTSVN